MEVIPESAEQWLKDNDSPASRAAFDELYGKGQAAASLGIKPVVPVNTPVFASDATFENTLPEPKDDSFWGYTKRVADDIWEGVLKSPVSIGTGLIEGGLTNPSYLLGNWIGSPTFDVENKDNKSFIDRFYWTSPSEFEKWHKNGGKLLSDQGIGWVREKADDDSVTGSFVTEGSKFAAAFIGIGKVLKGANLYKSTATVDAARGVAAVGLAYEGNEGRATDFLLEMGLSENVVTDFLKTNPDDSDTEGRLKTMLEEVLLVGAVSTVAHKLYKAMRKGDNAEVERLTAELEEAQEQFAQVDAQRPHDPTSMNPNPEVPPANTVPDSIVADNAAPSPWSRQVDDIVADETASVPSSDTISPQMKAAVEADFANVAVPRPATAFKITRDQHRTMDMAAERIANGEMAVDMGWRSPDLIDTIDDVEVEITAMSKVLALKFQSMNKTRSVEGITQQANNHAKKLAEMTGVSVKQVLNSVSKFDDSTNMAAALMARENYALALTDHITKLAKMLADQKVNPNAQVVADFGYRSVEEAKVDLMKLRELAANVIAMAQGTRSEIGRAMRMMQVVRKGNPEVVKILRNEGGELMRDADELIARLEAADYAAPIKDIQTVGLVRRVFDVINKFRINAMLSGVGTQVVNTVSSGVNTLGIPAQQLLGALVQIHKANGRAGAIHALRTYQGMIGSIHESLKSAAYVLWKGDAILDVSNSKIEVPEGSLSSNKMVKAVDTVVTLPSRFLLTMDEFFKQSAYRGRVLADAHSQALVDGLTGARKDAFIKQYIKDSFETQGLAKGSATRADALNQAQRSTFTETLEAGSWGANLQQWGIKYPPVRIVLPFIRTPINILVQGTQMFPAFGFISKRLRDDFAAGGIRRQQAVGKQLIGTLGMGAALAYAAEGRLTGSGPQDPQVRRQWLKTNQPYSFKMYNPDTGETEWVPYQRLEPWSFPIALAADLYEVLETSDITDADAAELSTAVFHAFMENTLNKTFTQGLSQVMDAARDKDGRKMNKLLQSLAGSFVPNIIPQVQNDQYQREIRSVMDAVLNRVGMNSAIDRKRNFMGEVNLTGKDKTNPFTAVKMAEDKVQSELTRLSELGQGGFDLPMNTKIDNDVDLKDEMFNETQSMFDRWMELSGTIVVGGKTLRQALEAEIASPLYQRLRDPEVGLFNESPRVQRLKKIGQKYRELAKRKLISESPEFKNLLIIRATKEREMKRLLPAR